MESKRRVGCAHGKAHNVTLVYSHWSDSGDHSKRKLDMLLSHGESGVGKKIASLKAMRIGIARN